MSKASVPLSPLSTLKRHAWVVLLTFPSVTAGATILSLSLTPRLYETTARLSVGEKDVGISTLGQALTDSKIQAPGRAADPVAIQAERVESAKVVRRALNLLSHQRNLSLKSLPTVPQVQEAMKVKIVPATNILQVNLRYSDSKMATALLNAIVQAAIDENVESNRMEAAGLRKFLESKIPQQQLKVAQAETAERQYRQANGVVALEPQMESLVSSLAALEDEERKLRSQLQESQIKGRLLQRVTGMGSPQEAYQSVRVGQNENLKEVGKQLTAVEVAIVDARSRMGDQNPDLLALLQKRDELRTVYNRQLAQTDSNAAKMPADRIVSDSLSQDLASRYIVGEIESQAIAERLQLVQAELVQLRSRSFVLPAHQQSLTALTRERESAEAALKLLNSKLEEAQIAEGQVLSNTRILQGSNDPLNPISPQPLAILAISAIAGLILSGALVLLLELMDTSLRTEPEVETVLELPVLGTLPRLKSVTADQPNLEQFLHRPDQIEPYRVLLKTLTSLREHHSQVLVLSSIKPQSGKASVVLHLAATAAMLSRRTLIIDADFRHPIFHQLLNVPAYPGLTEVIGKKLLLADAIESTAIENLFVLPCGRSLHQSSALIETAAMANLLTAVSSQYDCVLVNASAIEGCADAATLSQASDGLVVVIKPHSTSKDLARQAIADLHRSNITPLGIVLNETVLSIEKSDPILPPVDPLSQPTPLFSP